MKKLLGFLKPVFKLINLVLVLAGIFVVNYVARYVITDISALKFDKESIYSDVTMFNSKGGIPVFSIKGGRDRTVMFIGELNNPNPFKRYQSFFVQLNKVEGCNVIAPVLGTQSMPLKLRNRDWSPEEDMREAFQYWQMYTATVPSYHKMILVTKGSGNIAAAGIMAFADRKPDQIIMISPANADIVNDDASIPIRLVSTGPEWLKYIFPKLKNSKYREEKIKSMYPEYNVGNFHNLFKACVDFENNIVPKITKRNITIVWGEDDSMYKPDGYKRLAENLMNALNKVRPVTINRSRYYIMDDDGADELKKEIIRAVRKY